MSDMSYRPGLPRLALGGAVLLAERLRRLADLPVHVTARAAAVARPGRHPAHPWTDDPEEYGHTAGDFINAHDDRTALGWPDSMPTPAPGRPAPAPDRATRHEPASPGHLTGTGTGPRSDRPRAILAASIGLALQGAGLAADAAGVATARARAAADRFAATARRRTGLRTDTLTTPVRTRWNRGRTALAQATAAGNETIDDSKEAAQQALATVIDDSLGWMEQAVVPRLIDDLMPQLTVRVIPELIERLAPHLTRDVLPQMVDALTPHIAREFVPRLVDELMPYLIQSVVPRMVTGVMPEIQEKVLPTVIDELAHDPAIRDLVTTQSLGVLADAAGELRSTSASADDALERGFRRLFRLDGAPRQ